MAGADVTHTFKGTFDGAGYTLTVNYNTAAGCTAPFRFVDGATIRNLHVAGTITSSEQFASGFVGEVVYGHDVNITNCRSSVAINSNVSSSNNGYGTHGGFVGAAQYIVNITGCIFDGSFTTTNGTHSCGGFIGYSWVGSEHMHISNSVLAPTSVSSGMLDKTFVRYGSGTPDITNCYYIPVTNMPTNQGKETHTITAGENVSSVAIGGTATEYNVSGIKVYGANNGIVYAANGEEVNLALTANPPTNYIVDTYTASAGTITAQTETSATLTMPNENVTIGAVFLFNASYIDENGIAQTHGANELTSSDEALASGWYVVNEDVAFSNRIVVSGTVNLILADGKTLTASAGVNVPENSSLIIWGQSSGTGKLTAQPEVSNQAAIGGGNEGGEGVNNSAGTITIYGGKVTATSWAGAGIGDGGTYVEGGFEHGSSGGTVNIYGGTITAQGGMSSAAIGGGSGCTGFTVNIYGGTINATSGAMAAAIGGGYQSTGGTVNIHGGNITANAIDYGGSTDGFGIGSGPSYKSLATVNLSWTNTTDRITATSYNGTVTIADGQSFYNGSEVISGTDIAKGKLNDKTLVPYGMTLAAKEATVNDETNYWTTYYCGDAGLAIDDAENACAYTATYEVVNEVGTITLHRLGKVIPAGTAVIIVGADASIGMTVSTADAENVVDNHLHGLDAATPLATVLSDLKADAILMLSNKNQHFGFHDVALTNIPARKAFLALSGEAAKASQFNMVFDENTTAINEHESHKSHELSGAWYTLDGRRIANGQKPTAKGLYIVNGRKVVIK